MARILDIMSHYPTPGAPEIVGGAEVSRVLFHKVLRSAGHETMIIRGRDKHHPILEEFNHGSRIISIPFASAYSPLLLPQHDPVSRVSWHLADDFNSEIVPQIATLIDQLHPDIVMTGNLGGLSTAVWLAAHQRGVPLVHYVHDYYLTCHRSVRHRRGKTCVRNCTSCTLFTRKRRDATSMVDAVIFNSQFVRDLHTSRNLFANASKSVVIPYVHELFTAQRKERVVSGVRFGFLGRISPEKGVEALIRAFVRLSGDHSLVIGGKIDDATKSSLMAMAGEKTLAFRGFVAPADFFQEIDVLIVPSLWEEPLGRVALEAMSAGVAVAAARRGGLPEAVGDTGWLFDPANDEDFAAMLSSIAAQAETLGARALAAQARAESFTITRMVGGFEAAFATARNAAALAVS